MENQSNLPLFTVIIPTKDRAKYLEHTLRTCMVQDYPNFEIIISDDGSTDNSIEVVEKAMKIDSRVKLFSHNPGLGMKGNFEFALNQVRPGYVIALGGDDGLIPGCIQEMYKILIETKTELLTWVIPHYIFYNGDFARLVISRSKKSRVIKSKDFLNRVAHSLNYLNDVECPMFYIKGVVSTKLIDRVKSRTTDSCFYSCPTPDGYSGIVLAGEVEEFAFTSTPLSIGGDSSESQGLAYLRNDVHSMKKKESFFMHSLKKPMHKELASQPYSPLITLMTADYLLTARDLPGIPGQFPIINYENLVKKCFTELERDYSQNDVIVRELNIISKIAEQHGLMGLFNELMNKRRKIRNKRKLDGGVITPRSIIINCKEFDIKNIYDAANATKYFYRLFKETNIKNIYYLISRSVKTYLHNRKYRFDKFPSIN